MINEWEAKYKALSMGIDDKTLVETAEVIVQAAIDMSQITPEPFEVVLTGMLHVLANLRTQYPPFPNLRHSVIGVGAF
jgi:hypothetical protein